jgi:hypothetical protein
VFSLAAVRSRIHIRTAYILIKVFHIFPQPYPENAFIYRVEVHYRIELNLSLFVYNATSDMFRLMSDHHQRNKLHTFITDVVYN